LSTRFPPDIQDHQLLELDLRGFTAGRLLGRRGQLLITTRLEFKSDDFRQHESVFRLWADVQVTNQAEVQLPDLGRVYVRDPVFFTPQQAGRYGDAWTRSHDLLMLDMDYRQLDEIEAKRDGGPLTFRFTVGGTMYHEGRVAPLLPSVHQLTYPVSASEWTNLLSQLGYGTYLSVEIPLTCSGCATLQ
jgi:hypothetical protein